MIDFRGKVVEPIQILLTYVDPKSTVNSIEKLTLKYYPVFANFHNTEELEMIMICIRKSMIINKPTTSNFRSSDPTSILPLSWYHRPWYKVPEERFVG